MRRATAMVAAVLATTILITGCGNDAPDTPPQFTQAASGLSGTGVRVIVLEYGGAPVVCFKSEWGSMDATFGGLSCDWGRWRGEHPNTTPDRVTPARVPFPVTTP